ncbi:hypothetical protein SD10_00225 [Spirosoma radiotolerans]|uniref:Uncharacterized protein n=2 Tax=Spirosoma radiotolerans TaxID=1379870 RepID=A0A0E3ZRB6_9BACT|nr:hypothetical protein SD10_00225 [Spirosoma radiotolerans]
MLLVALTVLSCGTKPLDKKYRSQTMWYDIRVGSSTKNDSINHELCRMAVAENTAHGVKSEELTYQELIDHGYELLGKTHTEAYVDSLRELYGKR